MGAKQTRHRSVLVVGGGVGGLATAIALARRGDEVEVAELKPDWSVAGWGLLLTGPALRSLDALGLTDACAAEGYATSGEAVNCDSSGEVKATFKVPSVLGEGRPVEIGLARPVLLNILRGEAEARGVRLRTGLTVDTLAQDPHGVTACLSNGEERRFDLVVGADGIRSAVRDLLGQSGKPEYTGQMVWRALVPRPDWVTTVHTFNGSQHGAGVIPISDTRAYVFLTENTPEPMVYSQDELADRMVELMADLSGRAAELRAAITDPEDVVRRRVETCLIDGDWHVGRVVLVGDAAHAPSPQMTSGAALAIEDGVILAEELDRNATVEDALRAFSSRRLERGRHLVNISVEIAEMYIAGRLLEAFQLLRDGHAAMARRP
ncbi:FAD-dependent monooxygenase [Streptomyces sp. NPDC101455]|uniref:FAD-dependent monooxygenase n=1 Tax=Streptomyces sp. NPDC101455 TaxID=3366142 RepID=UPI00380192A9